MKFKYLLLLLILAGMIVTSGCMDAEAQPLIYKAPANLYRSIFFPYAGLLNQEGPGIQGGYQPPDSSYTERPPSGDFNPENPLQVSPGPLRDATALLDSNIDKAEDIAMRIELGIKYFQADGQDVSRLQELFEEYTRLIEEAKEYRELADSASGEENDYVSQREYLVRSQESMMQANLVLKEIFEEFQHLMPGSARINETDRLSAEGSGKAVLSGSFTLNMHLENGILAILELSPDSAVYIKGDYRFEEQTEGPHTVFLYYIRSADIEIPGSRKAVLLNAENISLTASEGKGQATFFGNGTYAIEDADGMKEEEEKRWANSPAEMDIVNTRQEPDRMPPTELRDGRTGMHLINQGYTSR